MAKIKPTFGQQNRASAHFFWAFKILGKNSGENFLKFWKKCGFFSPLCPGLAHF